VHFPAPGDAAPTAALTQAPYTITRVIDEAPAPASAPPQPAQNGSHASTPPASGAKEGGMDLEAAYEYFLDRFKRDLIIEREQSGHLLIDNP
jgi:hypothetical protein